MVVLLLLSVPSGYKGVLIQAKLLSLNLTFTLVYILVHVRFPVYLCITVNRLVSFVVVGFYSLNIRQ